MCLMLYCFLGISDFCEWIVLSVTTLYYTVVGSSRCQSPSELSISQTSVT